MYRRAQHVAWQTVQHEAVLVDLSAGNTLGLNATGSFVWKHLEEDNVDGIAARVAEEFSIDVDSARRDVEAFIEQLISRNLVSREES
jgi:hypothetical protein